MLSGISPHSRQYLFQPLHCPKIDQVDTVQILFSDRAFLLTRICDACRCLAFCHLVGALKQHLRLGLQGTSQLNLGLGRIRLRLRLRPIRALSLFRYSHEYLFAMAMLAVCTISPIMPGAPTSAASPLEVQIGHGLAAQTSQCVSYGQTLLEGDRVPVANKCILGFKHTVETTRVGCARGLLPRTIPPAFLM
jgi:hypothetical protein